MQACAVVALPLKKSKTYPSLIHAIFIKYFIKFFGLEKLNGISNFINSFDASEFGYLSIKLTGNIPELNLSLRYILV
jgi:hypothetical protein